jgi:hypothetical protein
MVAEEIEDAKYKNKKGAYDFSEEAGHVAKLCGLPCSARRAENPDQGCPTTGRPDAQPGDHPVLWV